MKKDELISSLEMVLFHKWEPAPIRKANLIISLCGYYSPDGIPNEIQSEVAKLTSQIPAMQTLHDLLKMVRKGRSNNFEWNPHFVREHMPDQITLSPTFNIQRSDDSSLVAQIEKVRSKLEQETVDIAALIAYISKQAKEAGDLDENNG